MKISELIKDLQKLAEKYGDDTCINCYNLDDSQHYYVGNIYLNENTGDIEMWID